MQPRQLAGAGWAAVALALAAGCAERARLVGGPPTEPVPSTSEEVPPEYRVSPLIQDIFADIDMADGLGYAQGRMDYLGTDGDLTAKVTLRFRDAGIVTSADDIAMDGHTVPLYRTIRASASVGVDRSCGYMVDGHLAGHAAVRLPGSNSDVRTIAETRQSRSGSKTQPSCQPCKKAGEMDAYREEASAPALGLRHSASADDGQICDEGYPSPTPGGGGGSGGSGYLLTICTTTYFFNPDGSLLSVVDDGCRTEYHQA